MFKIAKLKFTLPPTPLNMNTSLKAFTGGPKLERIQKERFTILSLERKFCILNRNTYLDLPSIDEKISVYLFYSKSRKPPRIFCGCYSRRYFLLCAGISPAVIISVHICKLYLTTGAKDTSRVYLNCFRIKNSE